MGLDTTEDEYLKPVRRISCLLHRNSGKVYTCKKKSLEKVAIFHQKSLEKVANTGYTDSSDRTRRDKSHAEEEN